MNITRPCLLAAMLLGSVPLAAQAQEPAAPHEHAQPVPAPTPAPTADHSAPRAPAPTSLPPFIPPLTDADREAAFPDVHGHGVHDNAVNYFVLFDQFEGQAGNESGLSWDTKGWVGKDRNRLWFRAEGERIGGRLEQAQTNLLYGRAVSRWWEATAGVRLDTLPDTPRTAVAIGLQGLAPYWFEVEASAYVEFSGRSHLRIEVEHELLLTNRLVLQPLMEFEIYSRADTERRIDAGLSTGELGLRLRYQIRREFAPYVGVVWHRRFFGTADYAKRAGEATGGARLAVGVRFWM
ncbi:MAG TPA: copper resistance protein B [Vicinamibacterales bacterium]|nr:copper resistance protein B [Vicinamibacterales bacterium]